MCGIVGYVGDKQAAEFLLEGLSKLEYRGYDSAGIAVYNDGSIRVEKSVGRLASLRDKIKDNVPQGRWALVIPAGLRMAVRLMPTPIRIRTAPVISSLSITASSRTT